MNSDKKKHHNGTTELKITPKKLGLIPRGDSWLYVAWDWNPSELKIFLKNATDGKLIIKLSTGQQTIPILIEVQSKASGWFVPLSDDNSTLSVELGFFDKLNPSDWCCLSEGTWPANKQSVANKGTNPGAPHQKTEFPYNHFEAWGAGAAVRQSSYIGPGSQIENQTQRPVSSPLNREQKLSPVTTIQKGANDIGAKTINPAPSEQKADEQLIDGSSTPQQKFEKGSIVIEYSIFGRVEGEAQAFWNGKQIEVSNGTYNLRIQAPQDRATIIGELAIVSQDGKNREVREVKLSSAVKLKEEMTIGWK